LPKEFYAMTWKEFILLTRGWQRGTWKKWEHTRLIAYVQATTNNKSKRKLPKMEKWFPLPTDKEGNEFEAEKYKVIFEKARLKHAHNGSTPGNKG